MKYLFNSAFKATRKGEYVVANDKYGEFVHDTDMPTLAAAQITEIATANKLDIPKNLKKQEALDMLADLLSGLKLDVMNQKPDSLVVEEICAAGHASGKTDDEMLIEIVSSGVKFSVAGKLFKQVMEAKGYRVSAKERLNQATDLLEGSELATADEVGAMIEAITSEVPDTTDKQALSLIKKYAKSKNIELPELKKAGATGKSSFRKQVFNWMIANPTAENAALQKWMEERGKNASVIKRMTEIFETAKKVAEAVSKKS